LLTTISSKRNDTGTISYAGWWRIGIRDEDDRSTSPKPDPPLRANAPEAGADKASARGGVWMRRLITASVLTAIILLPAVFAFTDIAVTLQEQSNGFLGLFKGSKLVHTQGYLILPEVRQTALAIVGFYFGSSQVK
jgi:hypothetical protein